MKAILEIEAPESCEECGLYKYKHNLCFCMGCNKVLGNLGDRAFFCPLKIVEDAEPPKQLTTKDMTLRDYFAGQALAGLIALATGTDTIQEMTECAYKHADAMLMAREASHE